MKRRPFLRVPCIPRRSASVRGYSSSAKEILRGNLPAISISPEPSIYLLPRGAARGAPAVEEAYLIKTD